MYRRPYIGYRRLPHKSSIFGFRCEVRTVGTWCNILARKIVFAGFVQESRFVRPPTILELHASDKSLSVWLRAPVFLTRSSCNRVPSSNAPTSTTHPLIMSDLAHADVRTLEQLRQRLVALSGHLQGLQNSFMEASPSQPVPSWFVSPRNLSVVVQAKWI